jgi:hypothetical protein
MIYTTKTLDARIDNVQLSANVNKATNPTRSTYEDGFANGLSDVFQTVRAQAERIAELEAQVAVLTNAVEASKTFSRIFIAGFPNRTSDKAIKNFNICKAALLEIDETLSGDFPVTRLVK